MADERLFDAKQHVFVLRSRNGEVVVGTDNLKELSTTDWFREFLGLDLVRAVPKEVREEQVQRVATPLSPLGRRIPSPSFLDVVPDKMSQQMWDSLSPEQQQQWLTKYGVTS